MLDAPILEVYYADTCVPCRHELPVLAAAARDTRLVIYVLDRPDHLDGLRNLAVVTAPADPRTVLRQAGDADGILPYARSVNATGTLCGSWRGILTADRITGLLNACAAPVRPAP